MKTTTFEDVQHAAMFASSRAGVRLCEWWKWPNLGHWVENRGKSASWLTVFAEGYKTKWSGQ